MSVPSRTASAQDSPIEAPREFAVGASPCCPDQQFSAFLSEGRFMLQRCLADGSFWFYPRVLCPHCGSSEFEWSEVSGNGAVYSTTVIRREVEEGGDHNVILVDITKGPG